MVNLDRTPAKIKRWVTYALIPYVLLVSPTIAALFGWTVGVVSILGVGVALIVLRLDDVKTYGFAGMKVELERSISEANATIAQLRKLAAVLARPIIGELALSSDFLKYRPVQRHGFLRETAAKSSVFWGDSRSRTRSWIDWRMPTSKCGLRRVD